jgi:hypothetical protein
MLVNTLAHALTITGFVLIMMVVIEYINIQTPGVVAGRPEAERVEAARHRHSAGGHPRMPGSPYRDVSLYPRRPAITGVPVFTANSREGSGMASH